MLTTSFERENKFFEILSNEKAIKTFRVGTKNKGWRNWWHLCIVAFRLINQLNFLFFFVIGLGQISYLYTFFYPLTSLSITFFQIKKWTVLLECWYCQTKQFHLKSDGLKKSAVSIFTHKQGLKLTFSGTSLAD